jgi:hypothetical protein
MQIKSSRPDKPGWGIIDRFMPYATPDAQEEAYENINSLVKLLVRIDERIFEEEQETRRMLQPPLFK